MIPLLNIKQQHAQDHRDRDDIGVVKMYKQIHRWQNG